MQSGWKVVVGIGLSMIALGGAAYVLTGFASVTALIPAFVGLPVAGLGLWARNGGKAVLVVAGLLGLLAAGGPVARVGGRISSGEFVLDAATVVQILFVLMAVSLVGFIGVSLLSKSADAPKADVVE